MAELCAVTAEPCAGCALLRGDLEAAHGQVARMQQGLEQERRLRLAAEAELRRAIEDRDRALRLHAAKLNGRNGHE